MAGADGASPGSMRHKAEAIPSPSFLIKQARKKLQQHSHFIRHADAVSMECRGRCLVITGQLPSFYLKQVLQSVLQTAPGVEVIENRVQVVSCDGLSSPPESPMLSDGPLSELEDKPD